MTLFPIVERELRVAARRRSTYWLRFLVVVAALVLGLCIYAEERYSPPAAIGESIFHSLTTLIAVMGLLSGVLLTARSLSAEKAEGTLGLLFLTQLRSMDIVLGKLAASSANALLAMLAIIPVLAVPILLGGVSLAEFLRIALALGNLLFFSLSAGLLASSLCRNDRTAIGLAILINLLLGVIFPFAGLLLADVEPDKLPIFQPGMNLKLVVATVITWSSPTSPLIAFMTKQPADNWPWISLVATFSCGLFFLRISAWYLPRSWQEKSSARTVKAHRQSWRTLWQGSMEWRRAWRARQLDRSPIYWLAGRHHWKRTWVWVFLTLCLYLYGLGATTWPEVWHDPFCLILCGFLVGTIIKVWIAVEASQLFAVERRQGRLELLLQTPLSIAEMVHGQRLALLRQFGGPLACLLLLDVICLLVVLQNGNKEMLQVTLAGILALVLDVLTLPWLGMWMGISARRWSPAFWTVFYIMAVPWLATIALPISGNLAHDLVQEVQGICIGHWFSDAAPMLLVWTVSSIVVAGGCWKWSQHGLLHRFRSTAAKGDAARGG